jgi:hypothetical protein
MWISSSCGVNLFPAVAPRSRLCINRRKTAENSERTAGVPLFFRSPDRQRPRFSATDEMPLADNFLEEQQKQREWPLRLRHPLTLLTRAVLALPSTHPVAVPAKAGTDRPAARAAERWTPAFAGGASNIVRASRTALFLSRSGASERRLRRELLPLRRVSGGHA